MKTKSPLNKNLCHTNEGERIMLKHDETKKIYHMITTLKKLYDTNTDIEKINRIKHRCRRRCRTHGERGTKRECVSKLRRIKEDKCYSAQCYSTTNVRTLECTMEICLYFVVCAMIETENWSCLSNEKLKTQ